MASFVIREVQYRSLPSTSCLSEEADRQCCDGNPLWLDYRASAKSHPLYRLCVSIAWMLGRVLRVWCLSYGCGHSGSWKKGHFYHIFFFLFGVSAGRSGSLMQHWWHALAVLREARSLLSFHSSHSLSAVWLYLDSPCVVQHANKSDTGCFSGTFKQIKRLHGWKDRGGRKGTRRESEEQENQMPELLRIGRTATDAVIVLAHFCCWSLCTETSTQGWLCWAAACLSWRFSVKAMATVSKTSEWRGVSFTFFNRYVKSLLIK